MNRIRGCNEHLTAACPTKEPKHICRPGTPSCTTSSERKCPPSLGSPRAVSGTREEAVSVPRPALLDRADVLLPYQQSKAAPLPAPTRSIPGQSFSLCPEKSHHSKLLQNPSKSASSYLSCWLTVVAYHSKLEFNNLGVEQMAFPLCFYPECYRRETDNTISGIQSCT